MQNKKWRVLIVDDEFRIGRLIKKLIHWGEFALECVDVVDNGGTAFEIIQSVRCPDVVITDIRMPKINGLELIAMTREIHKNMKFVVISGYKEFEYAHQALQYGVEDYLLKPVNEEELDALAKYPDIQVIDGGIDNDNVETAQSQAAAVLAANPDLTGYLNCDACGSGVAAAIEEKGMQDKVTFVAMDNLIEILDYVKTGTITATSSTLPQEQGMYAVLMAYQAAQGMPLPANVDTGIGRITADNIDEWIETVSAK